LKNIQFFRVQGCQVVPQNKDTKHHLHLQLAQRQKGGNTNQKRKKITNNNHDKRTNRRYLIYHWWTPTRCEQQSQVTNHKQQHMHHDCEKQPKAINYTTTMKKQQGPMLK